MTKRIESLGELFAYLGAGASAGDILDQLRDVVTAVHHTGKAGKLTYTITVAPLSREAHADGSSESAVTMRDAIKLTMPQRVREPAVFYTNDDGELARSPLRQTEMFSAEAPAEGQGQEPAARDEATA